MSSVDEQVWFNITDIAIYIVDIVDIVDISTNIKPAALSNPSSYASNYQQSDQRLLPSYLLPRTLAYFLQPA